MISEDEIREWWNMKVLNYLQNYARRNGLTIIQARARFFTETREKFVDSIPQELKKFIDRGA